MKFRLVEDNELEKRAKYHRKRQRGLSPFYSLDGGNIPLAIDKFNNSVADGANGLMEDYEFLDSDPEKIDYKSFKDMVDTFIKEYKDVQQEDDPDLMYDLQRNFYKKYRPLVDKCKILIQSISPTGYGKNDFYLIKLRDLCKIVDNNFPYGWKPRNYKAESLTEASRFNPLKKLIIDIINYLWEEGYKHPNNWISDGWVDLKDGVETGIDDLVEVAENIYSYIKPIDDEQLKVYGNDLLKYLSNKSLYERYSLPEVDNAINHFRNDLGYNPDVDEVIDYMVRIGDVEEPEDPEKSMKWYSDWSSEISPRLNEDVVKNSDSTWSNKGSEGKHGRFKTKKAATKQTRAMYANGYNEDYDPLADFDSVNSIGKLNTGDRFKNRNGVVITIVEPTKDGRIQYRIGDEVRIGSERSIQNMLYANNYLRINESLKESTTKQTILKNCKINNISESLMEAWFTPLSEISGFTGWFDDDSFINEEERFNSKVEKSLNSNRNDIYVLIDEDFQYDPRTYEIEDLIELQDIKTKNIRAKKFVVNGIEFIFEDASSMTSPRLYFKSEDDGQQYVDFIDHYYDEV